MCIPDIIFFKCYDRHIMNPNPLPVLSLNSVFNIKFLILFLGLIMALSLLANISRGQSVEADTLVLELGGGDDTLLIIWHIPAEPIDSATAQNMMSFGYRKAGIGWTIIFDQGYFEGAGYTADYEAPTVIYTVDPLYLLDCNQDGFVNVADVVFLMRFVFRPG